MQIEMESGLMKSRARQLRQEATPAEQYAWRLLRGKRLQGYKFRRQHVLHGFIVDFFCQELRLCLELDGAPHRSPDAILKDKERDAELNALGYKVLHIFNAIVLKDPAKFREMILSQSIP